MSKNIYDNAKIYKIVDNAYTEQYIGSTTIKLSSRMTKHRAKYWGHQRGDKYFCTSFILFDKYGLENCKIELIEEYPCKDKEELRKREGYWIKLEDCVNKRTAGRTKPVYYLENIDRVKEARSAWYANNIEKVQLKHAEYRANNKEQASQRSRKHWLENIDKLKERHKAYYLDNLDKIREYRHEKIECNHCKRLYCRDYMRKHIKKDHPETLQ